MKIDWSKAPEGATHYWPSHDAWYKLNEEGFFVFDPMAKGSWGRCLPTKIEEPGMIPRPVKPEPEEWVDGLPPVGRECEVNINMLNISIVATPEGWRWCEVLAHRDECAIAWIPSANIATKVCNRKAFRPIRTQAEREIASIRTYIYAVPKMNDLELAGEIAENLYAAGLRLKPSA